jgi:energy-coupling factor transporter ATP-binding protein EcfA2
MVETFFGSRQIQFQNDEVDQVGQNLKLFQSQLNSNVTRYRHPWGEQHLKSVVRRVLNQDSQTNSNVVDQIEQGADPQVALVDKVRTIRAINGVFASARLPVSFYLEDGGLRARRGQAAYNIDRLSDGERAALLVAGAVLIRPKDSFIVIDEPERHLNPAIAGPLLSALVRVRTDLCFIFSTHDLNLLSWLQPNSIIHLRDSDLITEQPEKRRYDYSVLAKGNDVPEELKFAILGTRRSLLLVEGTATSEDQSLYGHLYPDWNIVAKGSCESVIAGVKALGSHNDYHWLRVAGIIDGDGRGIDQAQAFAGQNLYTIPVPTIENLFLHANVLSEMADAAHELFAGQTGGQRIASVEAILPGTLSRARDEIIARRIVWTAQRLATTNMVSVKNVKNGSATEVSAIDLAPIRAQAEAEFANAVGEEPTIASLQTLPIKATSVPQDVVTVLGFSGFDLYKQAVLGQIEADTPRGRAIKAALQPILPQIQS